MKPYFSPSLLIVTISQAHLLCQSTSLSATFMSDPEIGNDDDVPAEANVKHANYVNWDKE